MADGDVVAGSPPSRRRARFVVAGVGAAVLLLAAACTVEPGTSSAEPEVDEPLDESVFDPQLDPEPEPQREDLRELTWASGTWVTVCGADTPRRIELTDGVAELTPEGSDAEPIRYELELDAVVFGELTEDLAEDAVVPATCTIGEAEARSLEAVSHDELGAPLQLPTVGVWPWRSALLGAIEITRDRELLATVYVPGPDAQQPHLEGYAVAVSSQWTWNGDAWSRQELERTALTDPVGGHRLPGVALAWPDPEWRFRGPGSPTGVVVGERPDADPFQRVAVQLVEDTGIDGYVGLLRQELEGFGLSFDTSAVFAAEVPGAALAVEFAIASPSGDVVTDYLLAEIGDVLLVVSVDQDRRILDDPVALDVDELFASVEVDAAAVRRWLQGGDEVS
jgi:hypothetical protein